MLLRLAAIGLLAGLPMLIWAFQTKAAGIDNGFVSGTPWARVVTRLTSGEFVAILQALWTVALTPIVILLLLAMLRKKFEGIVIWFIGMYSGVMFCVYLVTPYDLVWHMSSSVDRVTLVIKLLVIAVAILELEILLDSAEARGATQRHRIG